MHDTTHHSGSAHLQSEYTNPGEPKCHCDPWEYQTLREIHLTDHQKKLHLHHIHNNIPIFRPTPCDPKNSALGDLINVKPCINGGPLTGPQQATKSEQQGAAKIKGKCAGVPQSMSAKNDQPRNSTLCQKSGFTIFHRQDLPKHTKQMHVEISFHLRFNF